MRETKTHFFSNPIYSYAENFGVILIEAISAGVQVVSTYCGGPEDFIREDIGRLVPVGTVDALKDAIKDILKDLDSFSPEKLHNYAEQKFGYEAVDNIKMYKGERKNES